MQTITASEIKIGTRVLTAAMGMFVVSSVWRGATRVECKGVFELRKIAGIIRFNNDAELEQREDGTFAIVRK